VLLDRAVEAVAGGPPAAPEGPRPCRSRGSGVDTARAWVVEPGQQYTPAPGSR